MRQLCRSGVLRRQVWQSDEGGRFWRDCSVYRVVEVCDPGSLPESFIALTPREIASVAPLGVFTNESRSAISLLLSTPRV
jgi:oxidase EvaA